MTSDTDDHPLSYLEQFKKEPHLMLVGFNLGITSNNEYIDHDSYDGPYVISDDDITFMKLSSIKDVNPCVTQERGGLYIRTPGITYTAPMGFSLSEMISYVNRLKEVMDSGAHKIVLTKNSFDIIPH